MAAYKIHHNGTKAKFLKWIKGVINGEEDPSQLNSHPIKMHILPSKGENQNKKTMKIQMQ